MGFALNLFDIVGINQEDRSDNLIVLTPSDHMLVPDFPGLPQDGCTVTFDRDRALSRRRAVRQLGAPDHPQRHGSDPVRRHRQLRSVPVEKQSVAGRHPAG